MDNKIVRERKEMQSLFSDPKFSRKAWQAVGLALLSSPAAKAPVEIGKDGNETYDSIVDGYCYDQLSKDIEAVGGGYKPTELEMILRCQIQHARHNVNAATFIRDTVGAKPIDESKIEQHNVNVYETLSDEELEMLMAKRKATELEGSSDAGPEALDSCD